MADISLPPINSTGWGPPLSAAIEAVNTDVETRAVDADVVHKTGNEAIAGVKTFATAPAVPDAAFAIVKVAGLQAALDGAGGGGIGALDTVHARYAVDLNGNPYLAARPTGVTEGAMASGNSSIAIGVYETEASGAYSVAIGGYAKASADNSVAIGSNAEAKIGTHSWDRGNTAVGNSAVASSAAATALGSDSQASGNSSLAVSGGLASGDSSIAIGGSATASKGDSVAIGSSTLASGIDAIAIGAGSVALDGSAIAIGTSPSASYDAIAIGNSAHANGGASIAAGSSAVANGFGSVAIGDDSNVHAAHSASILMDDSGYGVAVREHAQLNARDLRVKRAGYQPWNSNFGGTDPNADYPATHDTGIILDSPDGSSWRITVSNAGVLTAAAAVIPTEPRWTKTTPAGSAIWSSIACSADGTKAVAAAANGGVYMSTDSGSTWAVKSGAGTAYWNKVLMSSDGTKIIADGKKSVDSGATWTTITFPAANTDGPRILAASYTFGILFLINNTKLYKSTDLGVTWTQLALPYLDGGGNPVNHSFKNVGVSGDGTTAVLMHQDFVNAPGDIWRSTDAGVTWTKSSTNDSSFGSAGFTFGSGGGTVYTVNTYGNVLYSGNGGASWTTVRALADYGFYANSLSLSSNGSKFIGAGREAGIYVNQTGTPEYVQASGNCGFFPCTISQDGTRVYAATNDGRIYTSALPLAAA